VFEGRRHLSIEGVEQLPIADCLVADCADLCGIESVPPRGSGWIVDIADW
jgi:hypothetical protein